MPNKMRHRFLVEPLAAKVPLGKIVSFIGKNQRSCLILGENSAIKRGPRYSSAALGSHFLQFVIIAIVAFLTPAPVWPNTKILTMDGRTFASPIKPDDIVSIEVKHGNETLVAGSEEVRSSETASRPTKRGRTGLRLPLPFALKADSAIAGGKLISVGPGRDYKMPGEAAKVAKDGDTVEIDAGVYVGDTAVWRQNKLTIKGIGGRAHLKAGGRSAERKAIWVVKGNDTIIENIEFSGVRVRDRNGAGIRLEGTNLTLRYCSFHDNEMGILTGKNINSDILIEYCDFYSNTVDYEKYGALGHNIYIGEVKSFTLRYSYVHGAEIGHNVKSRARKNAILYNRIMDEENGVSSYLIDLANGGTSYIIGNAFHQNRHADNFSMISYGAEGFKYPGRDLYVVNNTFVNDYGGGVFIQNRSDIDARIVNNLFVGRGELTRGPGAFAGNLHTREPGFVSSKDFDYRLRPDSAAIDLGVNPGSVAGFDLTPKQVYSHPSGKEPRLPQGSIDVGAYELAPLSKPPTSPNRQPVRSEKVDTVLNQKIADGSGPAPQPENVSPPLQIESVMTLAELAAQVLPGKWQLVPAPISDVLYKSEDLNETTWGKTGSRAVVSAWSGWAWNGNCAYMHNGGHADYGGNEVYRFCFGDGWERVIETYILPDRTPEVPCPQPTAEEHGPPSSHTYDALIWSPKTKSVFYFQRGDYCYRDKDRGVGPVGNRRPMVWEAKDRKWRHRAELDFAMRGFGRTALDAHGNIVILHQKGIRILDPVLGDYIGREKASSIGKFGSMIYAPKLGRYFVLDNSRLMSFDERTFNWRDDFNHSRDTDFKYTSGMAWHEPSKRLAFWSGGREIRLYDPASTEWTVAANAGGPAPAGDRPLAKWEYVPDHDVFVGLSGASDGIWLYRLPLDG